MLENNHIKNEKSYLPNLSSLKIIFSIWKIISSKRKIQFFFVISLMSISGLLELTLIRYLLPLINYFVNPLTTNNDLLIFNNVQSLIRNFIEIDINTLNIIFYSLLVLISTFLKLTTLWINERYVARLGNDISYKAFSFSIRLTYSEQISKNSSNLIAAINKALDDTTDYIKCITKGIYFLIISLTISIGLFSISFNISLLAIIILSFIYLIVSKYSKDKLILNGKKIFSSYTNQTQLVQEGLGSIRDLIVNRSYKFYETSFSKSDISKRKAYADNSFLTAFPKILIEGIGIIIVLFLLYLLNIYNPNENGQNLGVIAAFAFGCQKLLPAIQTIYTMLSRLRSRKESVIKILNILNDKNKNPYKNLKEINTSIIFQNINLQNVSFKYKVSKNWNINSLNLQINKGEKIGIIGSTGSGKSTLIDLIIGLLKPNKGRITFNNKTLHSINGDLTLAELHSITSYVPQNIFISDDSVYKNIAYGLKQKYIDHKKVVKVAKQANIHDLIISKPNGYQSILGERGVNLSGGQIQRLGIARALYKDPQILILDEATSALDNLTEKKVLNSIKNLKNEITIIMIAHRLNTIIDCDKILELEEGNLKNILSKEEIKLRINDENF